MAIGEIALETSTGVRWVTLADGSPWPHVLCNRCQLLVWQGDAAYTPSGIPVCIKCRDEMYREAPKIQKPVDDPILKILHGKMSIKIIAAKSGMRLKDAESLLQTHLSKGLVRYNPATYQWEKVSR